MTTTDEISRLTKERIARLKRLEVELTPKAPPACPDWCAKRRSATTRALTTSDAVRQPWPGGRSGRHHAVPLPPAGLSRR
jgi:hypothetical protein